ncbi:hypothetical protein [Rhizobium sp. Root708]|nr:hypothetical protein [Rhizobium sp. Root708]
MAEISPLQMSERVASFHLNDRTGGIGLRERHDSPGGYAEPTAILDRAF